MILVNHKNLNLPQIGDVAVLDISATTIDQDEVQKIPSAESKGLPVCTEDYTHSFNFFMCNVNITLLNSTFCLQVFILIQKMELKYFLVFLIPL
jgi:hypothetical protein